MLLKEIDKEQLNCVASYIQFNIKAEAEANEYYFKLLNMIADEDKEIIKNIISDELNHEIILIKLKEKYTVVLPSKYLPLISLKKKE